MDAIEDGNRLPPPPGCPKAMYGMMIRCWYVEYIEIGQFEWWCQIVRPYTTAKLIKR